MKSMGEDASSRLKKQKMTADLVDQSLIGTVPASLWMLRGAGAEREKQQKFESLKKLVKKQQERRWEVRTMKRVGCTNLGVVFCRCLEVYQPEKT